MKAIARQFILVLLCMIATGAWAQDITNIHGVVSDDMHKVVKVEFDF